MDYEAEAKALGGVAVIDADAVTPQASIAPTAQAEPVDYDAVAAEFGGAVAVEPQPAGGRIEDKRNWFERTFDATMEFGDDAVNLVTGADTSTPEMEAGTEHVYMPEMIDTAGERFGGFGAAHPQGAKRIPTVSEKGQKVKLLTLTTSPEETAKIYVEQLPGVTSREDEQGNWWLKSAIDGKEYPIKSGFRTSDIERGLGLVLAGKAAAKLGAEAAIKTGGGWLVKMASTAVAEMGLESVFEGLQAASGGDFDKLNVALAGTFGAGAEGLSMGYKAIFGKGAQEVMGKAAQKTGNKALIETTGEVAEDVVPKVAPEVIPELAEAIPQPAKAVELPEEQIIDEVIPSPTEKEAMGDQFAKAAKKPKPKNIKKLGEAAKIDPKILAAADRLGYTKFLDPDHISSDFAFQELSQLQKSQKGSNLRDMEQMRLGKLGADAKKMIEKYGGTENLGGMSDDIQNSMDNMVNRLSALSRKQYGIINKRIPIGTKVPIDGIMAYFDDKITRLGGAHKLNSADSEIYKKLTKEVKLDDGTKVRISDEHTYDYIDEVRQDVGAKTQQRDKFNDKEKSLYKALYAQLTEAQEDALTKLDIDVDVAPQWERAKRIVRARIGIEDDMKALYGSKVNQSIVQKLIGANKALELTDGKKFADLIKSVPKKYRQEFTASAILKSFGKENENGVLNYNTFPIWYENMSKNDQAKAALMSNLPKDLRVYLDDLNTVSKGVRDATIKYAGNGASLQPYYQPIDSLKKKVANVAVDFAKMSPVIVGSTLYGGPAGSAATATYTLMSSISKQKTPLVKKVDALFSNPKYKEIIIDSVRETATEAVKGQGLVNTSKKLAKLPAFRSFAKAANLPQDPAKLQQWILTGLRAKRQLTDKEKE